MGCQGWLCTSSGRRPYARVAFSLPWTILFPLHACVPVQAR